MKTIQAVYERGVLRPLEPLTLAEGTRVKISVPDAGTETREPTSDSMLVEFTPGEKTPAEICAEIAALPIEGKTDPFSGEDHDKVLYGWDRSPVK